MMRALPLRIKGGGEVSGRLRPEPAEGAGRGLTKLQIIQGAEGVPWAFRSVKIRHSDSALSLETAWRRSSAPFCTPS